MVTLLSFHSSTSIRNRSGNSKKFTMANWFWNSWTARLDTRKRNRRPIITRPGPSAHPKMTLRIFVWPDLPEKMREVYNERDMPKAPRGYCEWVAPKSEQMRK